MTNEEAINILRRLDPPRTSKKHFDDFIQARDMAIDSLSQPDSCWIPVTERLPDKEKKTYWVCLDDGGQCQCRWTNDVYGIGANAWSRWGWKKVDLPQFSEVVAYMPLPEPYKGVTT